MDLLHHLGKRKRRIVTFTIPFLVFTYHIKTLQEESAKKSNIPWIWRIIYGHKLPYMKKTKITLYEEDKKEEASMRCSLLHGSWDQILRRRPTFSTKKHRCKWRIFFKFCTLVCLGVPSINLLFVLRYLIKYAHNSIISDFIIFGFHRVIF